MRTWTDLPSACRVTEPPLSSPAPTTRCEVPRRLSPDNAKRVTIRATMSSNAAADVGVADGRGQAAASARSAARCSGGARDHRLRERGSSAPASSVGRSRGSASSSFDRRCASPPRSSDDCPPPVPPAREGSRGTSTACVPAPRSPSAEDEPRAGAAPKRSGPAVVAAGDVAAPFGGGRDGPSEKGVRGADARGRGAPGRVASEVDVGRVPEVVGGRWTMRSLSAARGRSCDVRQEIR